MSAIASRTNLLKRSLDDIERRWADFPAGESSSDRQLYLERLYSDETFRRYERLNKCKDSVELQALVLVECRNNPLTWINDWVWTFDPRLKPSMRPFLLFPKQAEYIAWRLERRSHQENGLTEKSRDAGITWLNVCHQVHCWLFEDGFAGAFGSRKELLVDRIGDLNSIFQKIRFLLGYLPKWMLPKDFDWAKHDNFCKIVNPNNGATITGEAGDSCGRGGRSSFYDLDEAAFIERPQKVDAAVSNNTNVVFYTSSANGIGNLFYKKRMTYPPHCVFRFHWRDDPRKDDEWYAGMKAKYDPVTVASEVDIDYGASVEGIYIPNDWVMAAVAIQLPPSGDRLAALDVATTGKNRTVFGTRRNGVVEEILDWQGLDTTQSAFKVRQVAGDRHVTQITVDADGEGGGVASTWASIPHLEFRFIAFRGAASPSDRFWVGENKTSKEKFYNARAEAWGILRDRFRKTYNHVNKVEIYPEDELISIPNNPTLIAQLSQPKYKFTSSGKILIESKEDMRKRGVESPDFADMLAYLFAPSPATDFTDDWLT